MKKNVKLALLNAFLVLDPKGPRAAGERSVMITAVLIMLLIVVPVLITLFVIARKYRAGSNAERPPATSEAKHGFWHEIMWWTLPAIIVAVLAVITWGTAHALDPMKPIDSNVPPLTIQVVAMDWKWFFIYPQQNIATVNFIEFPAGTPLNFQLTAADAPMNSFWIPQLGGQLYAMPGMVNQLHLMADAPGEFTGRAAEINGDGFSGMTFDAQATSQADFDSWVASIKQSSPALTEDEYNQLVMPSQNNVQASYSTVPENLYNTIVNKDMAPGMMMQATSAMPMDMPGMKM